ncbi:MAG: hypothetical protein U0930_19110, partial [Pirellulales bacterium]
MATVLRSDNSHNVSYPHTPDSRGTARIYYLRKPYYLGNHDSPLSYVMFGIWKHYLTSEGKVPPTAQIREQAEALLNADQADSKQWHRNWIMGLALTLAMLVGGMVGANFRSTQDSSHVDGIALTENELSFVRNYRAVAEKRAARRKAAEAEAPELFAAIQEGRLTK